MKITYIFCSLLSLLFIAFASCTNEQAFKVEGRVTQPRLEGKWVFLVPMDNDVKARIGVDSVIIKDMKFTFVGDEEFLGRVTIARTYRKGTQDLLIATEPGTISVLIDSISSGGGTPQNEVLQQWKDALAEHDMVIRGQSQHWNYLKQIGDTVYAKALKDSIDQYNQHFRDNMIQIAKPLGKGVVYDLLMQRYQRHDQ